MLVEALKCIYILLPQIVPLIYLISNDIGAILETTAIRQYIKNDSLTSILFIYNNNYSSVQLFLFCFFFLVIYYDYIILMQCVVESEIFIGLHPLALYCYLFCEFFVNIIKYKKKIVNPL